MKSRIRTSLVAGVIVLGLASLLVHPFGAVKGHNLDRVVGARKDARGWLATVNNMPVLPGSGISETDAKIILSYLISQNSIDS